jgi:cyclopropane fatty-acyl-phospholipid synthase-like methyltransferase
VAKSEANFFDAWATYEEVLDRNYMFHDEIYRGVQDFLAKRFGNRLFTILDLGCGSARHFARALRNRSVGTYVGYDLSAEALREAKENLAKIDCPVELRHGELLEGVRASDKPFDLIFSSFALHHLSSAEKAAFFQSAYSKLGGDGILLLIDTMREEDERREIYLDRYCAWMRAEWKALLPEAMDAFCDHVRNSDFPESPSTLQRMAAAAGFARGVEIDRFRSHHILCFEKERRPSVEM